MKLPLRSDVMFSREEIEVDTKHMDYVALQELYQRITAYNDAARRAQLLAEFRQERPDFERHMHGRQFLLHVAYGEEAEAETMLESNPYVAQELLISCNIPFTDYSGRTFCCTAYEYAYWAKDARMCRMLEKYMNGASKQILLNQVCKMEEFIGLGHFKKPRGLVYTQNGQEHHSLNFDLTPLKEGLQAYIQAFNQSPKESKADWESLDKRWVEVGLLQRELPAHIAQEYCHLERSFADVSRDASLLDVSDPANLDRQFQFFNYETNSIDTWFKPDSYLANTGLGFSFAIWRGPGIYARGRKGKSTPFCDLKALDLLDKVRTQDLKQSLATLSEPLFPQTLGT